LGATEGFNAVNGYFYHVEFMFDDNAFIGDEAGLRSKLDKIGKPNFFNVEK